MWDCGPYGSAVLCYGSAFLLAAAGWRVVRRADRVGRVGGVMLGLAMLSLPALGRQSVGRRPLCSTRSHPCCSSFGSVRRSAAGIRSRNPIRSELLGNRIAGNRIIGNSIVPAFFLGVALLLVGLPDTTAISNDKEKPADVYIEFRDWSGTDILIGPQLTVKPDGRLYLSCSGDGDSDTGVAFCQIPNGEWFNVEISFTRRRCGLRKFGSEPLGRPCRAVAGGAGQC